MKLKESFGGMGGGVGKKERKKGLGENGKKKMGKEGKENGEKWGKRQHLTWNIQLLKNLLNKLSMKNKIKIE